jgi:flavin-dependent dehydrogenase/AcrR family transcriptional regulator
MEKTKNAETSQRILDAALALWNEKGYSQTTMRELARRLGMGVSSLYFYFRSKEEIVQFLYAEVNEKARARFLERGGGADIGASFSLYLEIKLELLQPQRSCLAAILKEAIDPESSLSPVSRESSRVLHESIDFFRELARSKAGGRESAIAQLLWLAHISVLVYWLHDRSAGSVNTKRLVEGLSTKLDLLPMAFTLPGAEEMLGLLSAVLEPPAAPGPVEPAGDDGAPAREVDVVVLGAGPVGTVFASFLKQMRPKTSILVLDRQNEPGHKIGESTLSGFCKATRSIGIRPEVMQRLFYPKNGLGFLHVTEATQDFTQAPEYVLETFDQTFQVERRVLDGLLIANAERLGVQVMQGAQMALPKSKLGAAGNVVTYEVGARSFRVRAPLLVDASGPAGVVSRALTLRTDEDVAFQTSSVWTYFSGIKPLASYPGWKSKAQFPRDQYTQHLCFREGWLWYIPVVSWQGAPTANLNKVFDRVLGSARGVPARDELQSAFACPAQDIVSIGLSLRSDRDPRIAEDPRGAFEHYARRYPAIRQLLAGATNLEDHYGASTSFMSRLNYRGHARQVAGDGWLLVGDAAFFVDPLISPGLTGGVAGAFRAALAAAKALDAGDFRRTAFLEYEAFIGELQPALERDNELVYMSFNHPDALALVQRFQEIDARRHFHENRANDYGIDDTNVWGILDPSYQALQKEAWAICREEELAVAKDVSIQEQTVRDYERMVKRLRGLLGPYVDGHRDLTPYVRQNDERRLA